MLGSRFLWKVYAGYAAVILLTAVVVGVFPEDFQESNDLESRAKFAWHTR